MDNLTGTAMVGGADVHWLVVLTRLTALLTAWFSLSILMMAKVSFILVPIQAG